MPSAGSCWASGRRGVEYRAALPAEAEEKVERRVTNGLTAEERERRELENRAKFRNALHAVVTIARSPARPGPATPSGGTRARASAKNSKSVLDRRIAEVRSRIAWFEAAANGNILPRMETW